MATFDPLKPSLDDGRAARYGQDSQPHQHLSAAHSGGSCTDRVFIHDDIDDKLEDALGELNVVDFDGLGFNPLRVDDDRAIAHVDIAGTLQDIFSSVFRTPEHPA